MQAPHPKPTRSAAFRRLAALFAVAGTLAACDRHSAQEVPESYGHGSAHADVAGKESFTDHHVDSQASSQFHFSDTQGTEAVPSAEPASSPQPSPAPAGTPAGHFF